MQHMTNIITSNWPVIFAILGMCGWLVLPVCAVRFLPSSKRTPILSDKIQETTTKEFLLNNSSNILRNSLNGDENITLFNYPLLHNSTPTAFNTTSLWQLKQTLLEADEIVVNDDGNVKIHNDFHYGINKSNQENNFNNSQKQPILSLSGIKPVSSSNLSTSSSTSSPRAKVPGIQMTNSTPTVSSYFERVEMLESLARSKNEKLLLHRNKRYLLFPEGSSFQLVFDLIIPIVDYTNFAIMGITCAVAWELPSKPPSEIIENFRTKLDDGTFGLSRRNDSTQQSLAYINSQRTEQQTAVDRKSWREGVPAIHNQHYLPQMSATSATTSGREHFLTNVPKPPLLQPSNSFYYTNYIQREKFKPPPTSLYGQHLQQQQRRNYGYKAFDTNHRKTSYPKNNEESPTHRNNFFSQANQRIFHRDHHHHPASKWNVENWQQEHHQQPQQTKILYNDEGDYWNKDNWWKRNKNRIENHWHKNQPKWSKYQEDPQVNVQTPMFGKRTGRDRKVLNKPPKHRVYPIFGKRRRRCSSEDCRANSFNDNVAKKLQDIHTKEHLQTRQKLYGKIEKLYKTRGQNGTACVLRALCETERLHLNSHYNEAPQSFVMELLRSIFALPKDIVTNSKELPLQLDDRYVNAVFQAHDVTQSCSRHYNDCEYSITYDKS